MNASCRRRRRVERGRQSTPLAAPAKTNRRRTATKAHAHPTSGGLRGRRAGTNGARFAWLNADWQAGTQVPRVREGWC